MHACTLIVSTLPLSLCPLLCLQFTMMSMTMFKEVFTELVEYLVERIQNNYALQILPNALLANSSTSATFASILLGFLLKVHTCINHCMHACMNVYAYLCTSIN